MASECLFRGTQTSVMAVAYRKRLWILCRTFHFHCPSVKRLSRVLPDRILHPLRQIPTECHYYSAMVAVLVELASGQAVAEIGSSVPEHQNYIDKDCYIMPSYAPPF